MSYEVKEIQCKVNDIYRIDGMSEEYFLDRKYEHERFAHSRRETWSLDETNEDIMPDTHNWIEHKFYLILTDYNLHLFYPTKYPFVSRDLVVEAHKKLIKMQQEFQF